MKIGYARTSTVDQVAGFDAHLRELETAGCDRIFRDQISSVTARPQLEAALDYVRAADTLVVTELDRLARSTAHLLDIADKVKAKDAALNVLNLGMDTSTPTGMLLFTVIGAMAAFEREMMLERQRDGIAAAKAAGKYKGRSPTARAKAAQVRELAEQGVEKTEIARCLRIGRTSVYRVLGAGTALSPT